MRLDFAFSRTTKSPLSGLCCVYVIRNLMTGDAYVGATINLLRRKQKHLRELNENIHDATQFQADWNKHGPTAFALEIIQRCNREEMDELEKKWVVRIGTYNKHPGGRDNIKYINADPEVRRKRSDRARRQHADGTFNSPYFDAKRAKRAQEIAHENWLRKQTKRKEYV